QIENFAFNLLIDNPGAQNLSSILILKVLGPLAPAVGAPSATAPVPRFIGGSVPPPVVDLSTAPQSVTAVSGGARPGAPGPEGEIRDAPGIGGSVAITQTLANNGTQEAPNVVVGGSLPSTWQIADCQAQGGGVCSFQGNNVAVSYSLLGPGQTTSFTFIAE